MSAPPPSPTQPDDRDAIVSLVNRAYRVEFGNTGVSFKNGDRFDTPAKADGVLSRADAVIVGVLDDNAGGAIASVAVLRHEASDDDERVVELGPLAVDPELQGRGLGRSALDEAKRVARDELGATQLGIGVVNHRTDLTKFYANAGFVQHGETRDFAELGDASELTRPSHFIFHRCPLATRDESD